MEALKSLLRFLEGWGIDVEEMLVLISISHTQIRSVLVAVSWSCAPNRTRYFLPARRLTLEMYILRVQDREHNIDVYFPLIFLVSMSK